MRKGSWTSKNGTVNRGIYTTSCVPHHKPKRARKPANFKVEENKTTYKININISGFVGTLFTFIFVPVDIEWKIVTAFWLILTSIHVEVED